MIRQALIGAHRTGKTTLAKAAAEKMNIDFISFAGTPVYEQFGLKTGEPVSWVQRMMLQDAMLGRMIETLEASRDCQYISDRCPLDLIAYTLAEVPQDISEEDNAWFKNYVLRCEMATRMYYDHIALIRPGIKLVADETSWSSKSSVVDKIDAGCFWALNNFRERFPDTTRVMPRDLLELEDRVRYIERLCKIDLSMSIAR